MNKTIEKIVLFIPFLIVFQLVFAGITALIHPIISTGTLDLVKWADRMNTTFFMGLWVVVWVYPILYGFFILSQKRISPGWQILSHSLIALVFIFLFGNNFGSYFLIGIPLLTTSLLNYYFLKRVFD